MSADLRAAAQAALEVLCQIDVADGNAWCHTTGPVIDALRAALAEPACCCGEPSSSGVVHRTNGPCYMAEQQPEPAGEVVAVRDELDEIRWEIQWYGKPMPNATKLFTHPPPEPVRLTESEIRAAVGADDNFWASSKTWIAAVARAVEEAVLRANNLETPR